MSRLDASTMCLVSAPGCTPIGMPLLLGVGEVGGGAAIAQGAAAGAAAGSIIPGWGTAAGAVIGAAGAIIAEKNADSADPESIAAQQLQATRIAARSANKQAKLATTRTLIWAGAGLLIVVGVYLAMKKSKRRS